MTLVTHIVPLEFNSSGILGGAERYAYEMARAMSCEFNTQLITFGESNSTESHGDLTIHRIRPFSYPRQSHLVTKTNPLSVTPLIRKLHGSRVVFCHQQKVIPSTVAALWGKISRKKVYAIPLGGAGWDLSSYVSTDFLYSGILHISKYSRDLLSPQRTDKSQIIYGGVSSEKFFPGDNPNRDKVVFVGRLLPHKGVDVLIEALPEDCPCVIAGTPKNEKYYRYLQDLSANKNVTFRHGLSDEELRQLYQEAICVVLPSVFNDCYNNHSPWTELLGQTIIEGMACGAPPVATNLAAFPEIIDNESTGFLFEERDSSALKTIIQRLRSDRDLVNRISSAAHARFLSQWTWDAVIKRCEHLIPELAHCRRN